MTEGRVIPNDIKPRCTIIGVIGEIIINVRMSPMRKKAHQLLKWVIALKFIFLSKAIIAGIIIVPNDYLAIQTAIDSAQVGDTVFVKNGDYTEILSIRYPITLIGQDIDSTRIFLHEAFEPTPVLSIESDSGVSVKNIIFDGRTCIYECLGGNHYPGGDAISINNSSYVLLDSIIASGGNGDSEVEESGRNGGHGINILNSTNVAICNSTINGGDGGMGIGRGSAPLSSGRGGNGVKLWSSTNIFIQHLVIHGGNGLPDGGYGFRPSWAGNGISAYWYSSVSVSETELYGGISDDYYKGRPYNIDETSEINFFTDIKKKEMLIPKKNPTLHQNYPNPFNPSTTIKYALQKSGNILLKIYNLSGQELEILANRYQTTGEYEITWQSKGLPSGIYFYRLQFGEFSETKKLILQK
ncbi:MAG: T9SS type A sorting domain-containing protein [Candidatus Lokiarchaeota archaeon]|nr:T9SS type A sorting domain-containing protein [Candidatus Lokiarchaeota archaeon]